MLPRSPLKSVLPLLLLAALLPRPAAASVCGESNYRRGYQLGLSLQVMLAGNLPDFASSSSSYGVIASMPLGDDALQFQWSYGSATNFNLYLTELNYRFLLPTPFFYTFLLGGGHFLHYGTNGVNHDNFGADLGFGFLFPMSTSFQIAMMLKTYLQALPIISVGGGFTFLL